MESVLLLEAYMEIQEKIVWMVAINNAAAVIMLFYLVLFGFLLDLI
jgi:hypothetical protein